MQAKKPIGLWAAVSIGIGGMIGAGIFSILGVAARVSGNAMYLSFILAGAVALLNTYSYARLGAKYPSAGGPVEFLVRGFGDGMISGGFNIFLWIGYIFVLALYARAFAGYAATFFPVTASNLSLNILATAIIFVFTGINFYGARAVGKSEIFIVSVKVGILVVLSSIGIFFIKPTYLSPSQWPEISNIFFGTAIVFVAYEGFGLITNAAEDMENPQKTLSKSLYYSVLIVIVIYGAIAVIVLGNLPLADIITSEEYALAAAAKPFLGLIGFKIVAIAALFSTSSAINATLYGGANVSYTIAKKGELPEIFERKIWGKSYEGLFITAGLVILLVNLLNLESVAMLGSASFLLIYSVVNIAHLRLYRETGANPLIVLASMMGCLTALGVLVYHQIYLSPLSVIVFASALLFSFTLEAIYRKYSKRRIKTRSCKTPKNKKYLKMEINKFRKVFSKRMLKK